MRRLTPLLGALLVLTTGLAACGDADSGASVAPTSAAPKVEGGGWVGATPNPSEQVGDPIKPSTSAGDTSAPSSDEVVSAALTDVEAYWARSYEDLYGTPYQPISGGFWAYGPDGEQPPCGTPAPSYRDIAGNAFYCPSDDLIAWDNVNLVPGLYDRFGGFTLGIVFAHEFGHAIQARAHVSGDTIMMELQADCFAGAWTKDVSKGGSSHFAVGVTDLDTAVAGFLELRDGVGIDSSNPSAHGTGFDRVGAFADGFENGLDGCEQYPDDYADGALVVTEIPFTDQTDYDRGGNLPLADVVSLATSDLEDFWTATFPQLDGAAWRPVDRVQPVDPSTDQVDCAGTTYSGQALDRASFYCAGDNTIYVDAAGLIPDLYGIGDYAVATELARQYASAALVQQGIKGSSRARNLQADCYAGRYASSGFLKDRPNQQLELSPGDLDEAVIAFLQTSSSQLDNDAGGVGTAFQRFEAYRTGFTKGLQACDASLQGS